MPTTTLTFQLPEEEHEYRMMLRTSKVHDIVYETDHFLRGLLKYGGLEKYTAATLAEEIRSRLAEVQEYD